MFTRRVAHIGIALLGTCLLWSDYPSEVSAQIANKAGAPPAVSPDEGADVPKGYVVCQSVKVDQGPTGLSGSLQILQDERITAEDRAAWGSSRDKFQVAMKKGRLRLIDKRRHVIAEDQFEVPLARIETAYLYGSKFPTYLITADYGIGFGSYAGPTTKLGEIRKGKFGYINLFGASPGSFALCQSLKNGWKIVDERKINGKAKKGKEIEVIRCHPSWGKSKTKTEAKTGGADAFVVEYSTFRFEKQKWYRSFREERGLWENHGPDDWPDRSMFP